MSTRKTLTSIATGALFALIGLSGVLCSARVQGSCASFNDFTAHPIDALTFVPAQQPEPPEKGYGIEDGAHVWAFEGVGNNSPGCIPLSSVLANELETLLAVGGLLITAGMITFRRGTRKLAASAVSASLAGALTLVPSYAGRAFESGIQSSAQMIGTLVYVLVFCALLGYAGGMLGKRLDCAAMP